MTLSAFPFGLDLAAINIQRGRDHGNEKFYFFICCFEFLKEGNITNFSFFFLISKLEIGLPSYTQWREPCGLTPIHDWEDLEKVVGPNSVKRMKLGYKHIDDIDLFVGGLAERPVVGGLVGPVFACIIAQQFSNLRKGDRFWYENDGFESSFTPAQLQSIRQVNLAQVICRTLGPNSQIQPHVFLPHTVSTNDRLPCGIGALSSIDLNPWLERDPFTKNNEKTNKTQTNHPNDERGTKAPSHSFDPNELLLTHLDLFQAQSALVEEPFILNRTIINNKLDLETGNRRFNVINNQNKFKPTTKRPVFSSGSTQGKRKKSTSRPNSRKTTTTRTMTATQRTTKRRKNKNKNRHNKRNKREMTEEPNDKARSTILIKFDKEHDEIHNNNNNKTPFSSKISIDKDKRERKPDKEYVILTPDQNSYDIEIKIKPKPPQKDTHEKIMVPTNYDDKPNFAQDSYYSSHTTTKRPQQFYNVAQPSLSNGAQYNVQHDVPLKPQTQINPYITYRPYPGIIMKQTTTTRRYNVQEDEITTRKPYYTTKKPFYAYGTQVQQDDKPFYSYPTVQNTDASGYYSANNDPVGANHDEFLETIQNANPMKPYHDAPLYQTNYQNRPTSNSHLNSPAVSSNSHRPQNSYGNHNQDDDNSFDENEQQHNGYVGNGPTYLDDFTSKRPDKLTTTYSYSSIHSDDEEYVNPIYNNGYGSVATNRPQDFTTFYTVMTTRRKQTRPTRPISYNPQLQNDEDSDDDDDDDDDSSNPYFSPTAVISNIVNTFNDYFSTQTTTRKPYIQHDDFYTYPSLPSHDVPYSRQKDIETNSRSNKRTPRHTIFSDDYEQSTYPAVLNDQYNHDFSDETDDDGHKTITFDKDGYLRPEYMKYDQKQQQRPQQTANDYEDINAKLDMTQMKSTTMTPFRRQLFTELLNENVQLWRHNKQITTLNDDRTQKQRTPISIQSKPINQVFGLIPINVLTKPER